MQQSRINRIILALLLAFLFSGGGYGQDNVIVLTPTPTGSEGDNLYKDVSTFEIDATSGAIRYKDSNTNDDWTVSPSKTSFQGAKGKTFALTLGGMLTTNTTLGNSFGATATQGGIDRSSTGELGIRGGLGGGIHLNEGVWLGLDLRNLPTNLYMQISKIKVRYARTSTGCMVNRTNTVNTLYFGDNLTPSLVDGQGWIDVSVLNCVVKGGASIENLMAVFNSKVLNTNDSFRITGVELTIKENFDCSVIKLVDHPRLLLKGGEESKINNLIQRSSDFKKVHYYILDLCDSLLLLPDMVYKLVNNRLDGLHQESIYRIMTLAYGYRMTGDERYLNKAIDNLRTFCNFPTWSSYSLDVCESAFAAAIGYDWLYDKLSDEMKQTIRTSIYNKALKPQLGKPFWDMSSNWNQVCIGSLSMAAMAIYGDGTSEMDAQAALVIENILLKNPNSMNTYNNGNYPEGPMYWAYGTTYEVMMLSTMEGIYGSDHALLNGLINTPGFLESAHYMQYVTGTSGLVHNYADGVEGRNLGQAAFWMAKRLNNLSVLFVERELIRTNQYTPISSPDIKLPLTLIYGKDIDISNITPPVDPVWSGSGLQPVTFVRTDWQGSIGRYVGIKAGYPYSSHGHLDGGSFVYDSQGHRWAMDFGKEDYDAIKANVPNNNSKEQNSLHWDVFRIDNFSHNTISIKKSSATVWQHHNVYELSTLETIDTPTSKGATVDLSNTLGLNGELNSAFRTITIEDNAYLKVEDRIANCDASIDLYWNMATRAIAEKVDNSTVKLTQGGKTLLVKFSCLDPSIVLNVEFDRSTDPVTYHPTHTYERKNPGTVMIGFTATIPPNKEVLFTTTLTDGPEITVATPDNLILLELPSPLTGKEGNSLYYDESRLDIAPSGKVDISGEANSYAWRAIGKVNLDKAKGGYFLFRFSAMGSTNVNIGFNYGAMLTKAGIDRSSTGELGVRGGLSGGINPNEGYSLEFDLSGLPASINLKLAEVNVKYVNSGKRVTFVNRKNTNARKTVTTSGFVDVRDLNIVAQGGASYPDLASMINTSTEGEVRLMGFKFELTEGDLSGIEKAADGSFRSDDRIIVYPNPIRNRLVVRSQLTTETEVKVSIFSVSGECVYTHQMDLSNGNEEGIDFTTISSGIYLCLFEGRQNTVVKRVIKE